MATLDKAIRSCDISFSANGDYYTDKDDELYTFFYKRGNKYLFSTQRHGMVEFTEQEVKSMNLKKYHDPSGKR